MCVSVSTKREMHKMWHFYKSRYPEFVSHMQAKNKPLAFSEVSINWFKKIIIIN